MVDYVMTIDSDSEEQRATDMTSRPNKFEADDVLLDPGFTFEVSGEDFAGLSIGWADFVKSGTKPVSHSEATFID